MNILEWFFAISTVGSAIMITLAVYWMAWLFGRTDRKIPLGGRSISDGSEQKPDSHDQQHRAATEWLARKLEDAWLNDDWSKRSNTPLPCDCEAGMVVKWQVNQDGSMTCGICSRTYGGKN